jgi:hypothetical protein
MALHPPRLEQRSRDVLKRVVTEGLIDVARAGDIDPLDVTLLELVSVFHPKRERRLFVETLRRADRAVLGSPKANIPRFRVRFAGRNTPRDGRPGKNGPEATEGCEEGERQ